MTKKKRTYTSVEIIQQQFRRRMWRGIHIGAFLAVQIAIWLWWLAVHVQSNAGFRASFFSDRVVVLAAWGIILLTHIWVTYLLNKRDQQISSLLGGQDDANLNMMQTKLHNARRLQDGTLDDIDDDDFVEDEPSHNHNHR